MGKWKNGEEDVEENALPVHVGLCQRVSLVCRHFRMGALHTPVCVLLLVGIMVLCLVMEARLIAFVPTESAVSTEKTCMPQIVDVNKAAYHSGHRFYSTLKEMAPLEAPTFRGSHTLLCNQKQQLWLKFPYCLPTSGRWDTPFCTAADRTDLLTVRSHESLCYASVLHMLLVDVYDELEATGIIPLVTFGSLLGAVRNGSIIPYTEDVDIGYIDNAYAMLQVKMALRKKGYHMFEYTIWRVCVAPTHPLASRLYDPSLPLTTEYSVPYLDLYSMSNLANGYYNIQELKGSNGSLMAKTKVEPFSQVTINGMPFDTVHDPIFFLTESYGPNYMTPIQRTKPSVPLGTSIRFGMYDFSAAYADSAV